MIVPELSYATLIGQHCCVVDNRGIDLSAAVNALTICIRQGKAEGAVDDAGAEEQVTRTGKLHIGDQADPAPAGPASVAANVEGPVVGEQRPSEIGN